MTGSSHYAPAEAIMCRRPEGWESAAGGTVRMEEDMTGELCRRKAAGFT